jgi:hypothetical protein
MDMNETSFALAVIGTGCWGACFVWMYRISEKQNRLLETLTEQNKRIERWSKIEHDLIKEVHPQVGEIKESMDEMIAAVKENTEATEAAAPAGLASPPAKATKA